MGGETRADLGFFGQLPLVETVKRNEKAFRRGFEDKGVIYPDEKKESGTRKTSGVGLEMLEREGV